LEGNGENEEEDWSPEGEGIKHGTPEG